MPLHIIYFHLAIFTSTSQCYSNNQLWSPSNPLSLSEVCKSIIMKIRPGEQEIETLYCIVTFDLAISYYCQ